MSFEPQYLPYAGEPDIESKAVLKKAALANRYLAELKGVVSSVPNESILIATLTLQEAKDSSEIENIVTTHDELYQAGVQIDAPAPSAKEVQDYAAALQAAFQNVRKTKMIRLQDILDIQQTLEENKAGLRTQAGTALKNQQTGELVYTPPQDAARIKALMANLVDYINDSAMSDCDPLVKMAIIHFQFESIHPFYDGNGRTGRILNILYMIVQELLDLPVLYLSSYIIRNKADYYRLIQGVRDEDKWEPWLLFMLDGVEQTSRQSVSMIRSIRELMKDCKKRMREELPKIYSQELLNNLFRHPYTKIEFVERDLKVSRLTATKYLDQLTEKEVLEKQKRGRTNYYINKPLFELLTSSSKMAVTQQELDTIAS
ncbi:MAG: Fic family protein [Pseudohongiellaceae bacterium]